MSAAVARRSVMTASRMARTSIEAPTVSILELAKQDLDQNMKKAKVQSNYKRSGLNPRPPLASKYSYSYNLNLNSSFSVSAPAGECPAGNMRGRYACSPESHPRRTGVKSRGTVYKKVASFGARIGFISRGIHRVRKGHKRTTVTTRESKVKTRQQIRSSKCLFAFGFGLPRETAPKSFFSKSMVGKMTNHRRAKVKSRIPVLVSGHSKPNETYSFMRKRFGYIPNARELEVRRQSWGIRGTSGGVPGIKGGTRCSVGDRNSRTLGIEGTEGGRKVEWDLSGIRGDDDGVSDGKVRGSCRSHGSRRHNVKTESPSFAPEHFVPDKSMGHIVPAKSGFTFKSDTMKNRASEPESHFEEENRCKSPGASRDSSSFGAKASSFRKHRAPTPPLPKGVLKLNHHSCDLSPGLAGNKMAEEPGAKNGGSAESPDGSWEGYECGEESRGRFSSDHRAPVVAQPDEREQSLDERRSRLQNDLDTLLESMEKALGKCSLNNGSRDRVSSFRTVYPQRQKGLPTLYRSVFEAVI